MAVNLNNPDLTTDPDARLAVKDETVWVEFATETGDLISSVGRNRYRPGDALITGSTGDPCAYPGTGSTQSTTRCLRRFMVSGVVTGIAR